MDVRFALLLGCFVLSGCAALLYQTAWTRELSFVFGTSELAVAAVLAAYMGGLALGSAVAARLAPRLRRPVLAYGWLELAIAASALAVPAGIRLVNAIYGALLGGRSELPDMGAGAALFQLAGALVVLLPPTALMGATLPLLARHAVRSEDQLGSRVGVLYAVNTAGAIAGAVGAAFWLIPELGLRRAVWAGAVLNAVVFGLAALLARRAPAVSRAGESGAGGAAAGAAWILPAIAVSGSVSFAYEVLWTRALGHVLGASLYAFATMLASFLLGIALGSAVAARLATTRERARAGFAIAQLGIALTSYGVFASAGRLPGLAHAVGAGPDAPLASAAVAAAALLPITLCIGATFPFAVRWLALGAEQAARVTARVYAWNTAGAIAGALGTGFVLLPRLGFAGTVATGVAASALLAAGSALAAQPRRTWIAGLAAAMGVLLVVLPPATPWSLLRQSPMREGEEEGGDLAFAAVGRSSTVTLVDRILHWRLATNGLPEAAIDRAGVVPFPASIVHWLGLLPGLVRPEARDLLVVGFGGGSALEAVPSTFTAIDVVELEPEVLVANRSVAAQRARDPLADPRVRVHLGDARGSLRLTSKRYGAIVSQPSHPWTAGASHLYTREFFSLVRERLRPDGVFVQWIGLQFVDEALLRSLLAALVDVFGHVEVYGRERGLLFAASPEPIAGFEGAARALRATPADYARFGVYGVEELASAWLLDEEGARELARGAPPNTDDHNRLASRSARLGSGPLTLESAGLLFAPFDPLRSRTDPLDRSLLLRTLVLRGDAARAKALAAAAAGAEAARGLGWVELANNRTRSAAREFARALSLAQADADARVGLVASRHVELARGPIAEIAEAELAAPVAAVIAGWRHAEQGDPSAIAPLDAALASFAPGDALFREAVRLRASWRLASGGPDAPAEAVAILEPLLRYAWHPEDALLHARAAAAAGDSAAAWASLGRISALAPTNARGRDLARRAHEIAEKLPDGPMQRVRTGLAQRAGL